MNWMNGLRKPYLKHFLFAILFAIPLLTLISCQDNAEEVFPRSVSQIDSIWVTQNSIVCSVLVWTTNPCWDFDHHTLEKEEFQYLITIYTRHDGNAICPCVVWSISPRITIPKPATGEYLFRFWQSDSSTLDTLIKIN